MPYEFVDVSEYARLTGRHVQTVHKMIRNRTLLDAGYLVNRVPAKRGTKTRRWSIGIPVTEWCCADCGKEWRDDTKVPANCPGCNSVNVERRTKVA